MAWLSCSMSSLWTVASTAAYLFCSLYWPAWTWGGLTEGSLMQWSLINCKHNYDILPGGFKWKQSQLYQTWIIAWFLSSRCLQKTQSLPAFWLASTAFSCLMPVLTASQRNGQDIYSCHPAKFLINR
jgi:hypothetical protein